jgi:hypothetical protein
VDAREPRAHPAERSIALAARKLMPTNGFVAAGPRSFIPGYAPGSADPSRSAIRREIAAIGFARIHPEVPSDFLLESPSIRVDDDRGDRIRTMWDTRGFAAH